MPTQPNDFDGPKSLCPIPKAHRTLLDAHHLWHQTAENYSHPDLFRANLNATIQALRNVTFSLQSEKHVFDDFDAWYAPWQTRMKASSVLTWAKEARNRVVKQGELETASTATVRLLTWKDDELTHLPIAPATSSEALLNHIPILDLIAKARIPSGDLSSAVLELERQWNLPSFQNREALDALAAAYGLLSDLLVDAHTRLGRLDCIDHGSPHPAFRATHHRSGTLPCMTATTELRKERFSLRTRTRLIRDTTKPPEGGPSPAAAAARYGMKFADRAMLSRNADPDAVAKRLVYWSKRMLKKDRSLIRLVFVRDGAGEWHPMTFLPSDRSEKHLAVRLIAQFVEQTGADAIIDVGEVWYFPIEKARTTRDFSNLENVPGRREALQVLVAMRAGLLRVYLTPFSRGLLGGIKLGDTSISDEKPKNKYYLQPVFKVWAAQGTRAGVQGESVPWLWEPDPLDRCYCGGQGRFGSCCAPNVQQHSMDELQRLRSEALGRSDLAAAERFAQAALAQYVIWVRSHTAPTRHVSTDVHQKLVAIDVPALEAHVHHLEEVLEIAGRRADLVPRLRHISSIVGIPEATVHLTALAAGLLYEVGTRAEAAAELDRLGNLEDLSDSMALWVAALVFDGDHRECCQLFQRAIDRAEHGSTRCLIELDLADEYRRHNDEASALELVTDVLGRTRGDADLVVARALALELRWRLTNRTSDFLAAKEELATIEGPGPRRRRLIMLIDHGDLQEANEFLTGELGKGDVVTQLLGIEIRLRTNRMKEAEELLRGVPADRVTERLRLPYAHTIGLVALYCRNADLAATAVGMLRCIDTEEGGLPGDYEGMLEALGGLTG